MTVFALASLALLALLGTWQMQRAGEKERAIAEYRAGAGAQTHTSLASALCAPESGVIWGRRIDAAAIQDASLSRQEIRFYGRHRSGAFGWRVLRAAPAPACLCPTDGPTAVAAAEPGCFVAVQTGFETLEGQRLDAPVKWAVAAPERANAFTPPNTPDAGAYRRFVAAELAAGLGLPEASLVEKVWLTADEGELPAVLTRVPPARHIGYALTWYGLGLALVLVYVGYHRANGRFGRP